MSSRNIVGFKVNTTRGYCPPFSDDIPPSSDCQLLDATGTMMYSGQQVIEEKLLNHV